ncbi:ribonuclease H-like domain-containing protein [Lactarius quietus]|nr:ribonuclease H-like domain-containing protein [Lactarius quietus]
MPKEPRVYYAVRVGRKPGIYTTCATSLTLCVSREDCHEQVKKHSNAVFKKLKTLDAAEAWMNGDCTGSLPGPQGCTPHPKTSDSEIEPADSLPSLSQTSISVDSSSPTLSPTTITPTPTAAPESESQPFDRPGWSNAPLSAGAGPSEPTFSSSTALEHVVYTDGACSRNGQAGSVAGIGVWWGPGDPRNLSERCPGSPQTNNRAELIAIIRALETAPTSSRSLVIKSDSKYSMQCINKWLPGWRDKNFRTYQGTPVKNSELVMYADALISWRKRAGQQVKFQYVPGHAGKPGNEGADALAVNGCKLRVADPRNWDELRHQLENRPRENMNVVAEPVDASVILSKDSKEGT